MRRLLSLFIALAVFVTACTKPEPDNPQPNPETPKQESVTLSPSTNAAPVIATEGGSTSVSFTASTSWSASIINTKADSWCSVVPTSGVAGAASITITVKENTTPDNRSASVVIKAGTATQTIKVEQKQKDALTVTASSFEISADGGEIKVATKSNVSFTHAISTDAQSWIKAVQTKALKDSTLTFEIDVNREVTKRSGQIYLASGDLKDTVNVYQAGETPTIVVSQDEYILKSEGESFEVEVASNVNAYVSMVYPQGVGAWITENTTKAISTNKFYFTAQSNETYDSRSALLIFANAENNLADTVTVTQAQKDAIVLAKSEYEFGKDGGNLDFEIQTNIDITVSIPDSCRSWITHVETRAMETKQLHFNVASCDTLTADRIGYIVISGGDVKQTIKVTQSNIKEILLAEREALIAFYKATGGDNWTNNTNWCSDKPISEWYGITTKGESYGVTSSNEDNMVCEIYLDINNLSGVLPAQIGDFSKLEQLSLHDNIISGEIPVEISNLKKLRSISLGNNDISGEIPSQIGELNELTFLSLSGNNLEGDIPERIVELTHLEYLSLDHNNLSGKIPDSIGNLTRLICFSLDGNNIVGKIPESLVKIKSLEDLGLSDNSLSGGIPSGIGNLENLKHVHLQRNYLSGNIPVDIVNLKQLEHLDLQGNVFSGNIPSEIGNLKNLKYLNFAENDITGSIPESIVKLSKLEQLYIIDNNLSGTIPELLYSWSFWKSWWGQSVGGNKYRFDDIILPGPEKVVTCFNGKSLDLKAEYAKNKYTVLFEWCDDASARFIMPQIRTIHNDYSSSGIKVIGWAFSGYLSKEAASEYIKESGMEWDNFYYDISSGENVFGPACYPYKYVTTVTIVDSAGRIVFSDVFDRNIYKEDGYLLQLINDNFHTNSEEDEEELYESTDYSKDGQVVQLQRASLGTGIDLILLGDGFSDRQIADGSYEDVMELAMQEYFEEEPYKTYKDLFNVYYVYAVSQNEGYHTYGETCFSCIFTGDDTQVAGKDSKVFAYALKAIQPERMEQSTIVVIMNSEENAGTCFMYPPSITGKDLGDGVTISYLSKNNSKENFGNTLRHEANGHGFAKLADEYWYGTDDIIPPSDVENKKYLHSEFGWWKNIDFTDNPAQVKWAKFLTDSRYANDGLGVFEGGGCYPKGVWRPTENSIMRYNTGGFNAPSREAIYYRIHKLAYGADWQYDYEKFVEWDAINRKKEAQTKSMPLVLDPEKSKLPHTPPVVIPHSWREAR